MMNPSENMKNTRKDFTMSVWKKTLTLLLAALTLTQMVACGGSQEAVTTLATTTAATTEDPMNSPTPGIAVLTPEEKSTYGELAARNAERANILAKGLEKAFINDRGGFSVGMYSLTTSSRPTGKASVWHLSAVLSMTSKLWSLDAGGQGAHYQALYGDLYKLMQYHKGTGQIVTYQGTFKQTMYAVDRANSPNSASLAGKAAVYDDQMWIIRELIYAYQLTKEEKYLTEAIELTDVVLKGWDTTVIDGKEVGGICWGPGYETKHTCSNAPMIQPLVELYEIFAAEGRTMETDYLEWAIKIYDWCNDYLLRSDAIYGDLVGSSRTEQGLGSAKKFVTTSQSKGLDQNAYAYNTGTMISGGACLYRVTGEKRYLTQAKNCAKAAYREFTVKDKATGLTQYTAKGNSIYNSTVWFNLILLEGYLDLFPYDPLCKKYIDAFQTSLDYGFENHLDNNNLLPRDLLKGWDIKATKPGDDNTKPDLNKDVMDQAACAEIYAQLAEFYAYLATQ